MEREQPSKKRCQAIDGIIASTTAVVKANTTRNVSIYSDPFSSLFTNVLFQCAQTLARWFMGSITGWEALSLLNQEAAGLTCGVVGLSLGAVIGSLICPGIGTAIGAGIGAFAGYKVGKYISSRSTAVAVRDEDSSSLKKRCIRCSS